MRRVLVLSGVFFGVLVTVLVRGADGKLCQSLDIRNDINSLEKLRNCTVIMGYLHMVLVELVPHHDIFANHSFPELQEIDDHLLVFRVANLKSVGTLFPNLRVIRGNKLFSNYALVVHQMNHLEEKTLIPTPS